MIQAIAQLKQQLREKDTTIQQKEAANRRKDATIQEKEDVIRQKEETIRDKDTTIQQKEAAIQQREAAIRQRERQTNEQLRQKDATNHEKQATIQEKDDVIRQKDDTILQKQASIHEKTTALDQSNNLIQEKDDIIQRNYATIAKQQNVIQRYRDNPHWVIQRDEVTITQNTLGGGGWGEVKVGIFRGTKVAVKRLYQEIQSDFYMELFAREMDIVSRIRHPNLLQFIGSTREGDLLIVTELMPTSLRNELEKIQLTRVQAIAIAIDIITGLN